MRFMFIGVVSAVSQLNRLPAPDASGHARLWRWIFQCFAAAVLPTVRPPTRPAPCGTRPRPVPARA